jgi:hypothetical protein
MTRKQLEEQYKAEIAVNPDGWKNWQYMSETFQDWTTKQDSYFRDSFMYRRNPDAPPFVASGAAKSFRKLYEDNAQGIEIEQLKMRIEELESAVLSNPLVGRLA